MTAAAFPLTPAGAGTTFVPNRDSEDPGRGRASRTVPVEM